VELDFTFGSANLLNAELDVLERVRDIWFASGSRSNAER
jgi:hypothetical protein